MFDSLLPPGPEDKTVGMLPQRDVQCVKDALRLLVVEFDQVGPPGFLLKKELEMLLEKSGEDLVDVVRGLLAVSSLLVQSLALESGQDTTATLKAVALDVERLYWADDCDGGD